jgi:hypothetical protein
MPMPIDVRRIDDGDGIENTLINHHDKYHEACRLMFNNTKRAQKRRCPSKKRSENELEQIKMYGQQQLYIQMFVEKNYITLDLSTNGY